MNDAQRAAPRPGWVLLVLAAAIVLSAALTSAAGALSFKAYPRCP